MKFVWIETEAKRRVRISLDHYGAGTDYTFRRWIMSGNSWQCIETAESGRRLKSLATIIKEYAIYLFRAGSVRGLGRQSRGA